MTGNYDIQAGDGGTFIVRKCGTEWTRIATFIPGEYTEADEAILGNADTLADALEAALHEAGHACCCEKPHSSAGVSLHESDCWTAKARAALKDAGRGHLLP